VIGDVFKLLGLTAGIILSAVSVFAGENDVIQFRGVSDCSAGVLLKDVSGSPLILTADDEEGELRVFKLSGGEAVATLDIAAAFKEAGIKTKKEFDLEGATAVGGKYYFIGSMARNSNGKERKDRQFFFCITVDRKDPNKFGLCGKPYQGLLRDLSNCESLRKFKLGTAFAKAPKTYGAGNIEGLAADPEGFFWIGFRNPIPDNKALLVQLLNPDEVLKGEKGKIGKHILLDLNGLGVRDICWSDTKKCYFIAAGQYEGKSRKIYSWSGKETDSAKLVFEDFPKDYNAEVVIDLSNEKGNQENRLMVISDDGVLTVNGMDNKDQPPEKRTFRGLQIEIK